MDIYAPDEWTPTTEKLLADVADDSDLYLQKVSYKPMLEIVTMLILIITLILDAQQLQEHF